MTSDAIPRRTLATTRLALTLAALVAACSADAPTGAHASRSGATWRGGRPPAALDAAGAHARQRAAPFRFRGTTFSAPPTTDPRCPELIVHVTTGGHATHLGQFTGAVSHCVRDGSLDFTDGRFVFTAADGDELHGTHSGSFVPTAAPKVFDFAGRVAFVGGTGRFADATGDGALAGRIDMSTGVAAVSIDGRITY
jgi:hypothetical protein